MFLSPGARPQTHFLADLESTERVCLVSFTPLMERFPKSLKIWGTTSRQGIEIGKGKRGGKKERKERDGKNTHPFPAGNKFLVTALAGVIKQLEWRRTTQTVDYQSENRCAVTT